MEKREGGELGPAFVNPCGCVGLVGTVAQVVQELCSCVACLHTSSPTVV